MKIYFNKPHLTGKETQYMLEAVGTGKLSGNGEFTKKCQQFFEERYGFKKCGLLKYIFICILIYTSYS